MTERNLQQSHENYDKVLLYHHRTAIKYQLEQDGKI